MAGITGLQLDNYTLEAGFQTELLSYKPAFLSGIILKAGREFQIGKQAIELTGLYAISRFSELMHERNRGLFASTQHQKLHFILGTHFRTYAYNRDARNDIDLQGSARLTERWNLIYSIAYSVKPPGHPWNISLAVTNLDLFLIHQETNPMLRLSGTYTVRQNISLYLDAFYQQAGLFNINIHYFGFYIRPGIIWHIQ